METETVLVMKKYFCAKCKAMVPLPHKEHPLK